MKQAFAWERTAILDISKQDGNLEKVTHGEND